MANVIRSGTGHVRAKAVEELKLYWLIFIYLALMFGAFNTYRRLVLGESGISYGHYGAGLIEAAVIAKVILIGRALKLGHRVERHPLILTVLAKSLLFGLLVALTSILERIIEGFLRGNTWPVIAHHLLVNGPREVLARTVVMIISFIPFFGLWEIARVLGPERLHEMFFHRQPPSPAGNR